MNCNLGYTLYSFRSPSCAIIHPPPPSSINDPTSFSALILPHVIVWDPYLIPSTLTPQCIECNKPMERETWKLGQTPALEPRLLHGIEFNIILVSSRYKCFNGHSFLTTDPRVLKLLHSESVPFFLLHKTGFLKSFLDSIMGLIEEGLRVSAIERYIRNQRQASAARVISEVVNLNLLSEVPNELPLVESPFPSNDIILKCILAEFSLKCQKYFSAMSKIQSHCRISFDHTWLQILAI